MGVLDNARNHCNWPLSFFDTFTVLVQRGSDGSPLSIIAFLYVSCQVCRLRDKLHFIS